MKEENTLVTRSCVRLDGWFGDLKFEIKFVENYFFLQNYGTSEDTTNLSPLLVTKKGFMRIIILSNYQ